MGILNLQPLTMKVPTSLLVALLFLFPSEATPQAAGSPNAKLQEIRQRLLRENQPQVLSEAATLPPEVALPFLGQCLQVYQKDRGAFFEAARKAIQDVPDYDRFYAARLSTASKSGGVDHETLKILSLIGTAKAQAVVAPLLFDFAATPSDGHILSEMNAISAVIALGEMNIRDSPVNVKPGAYKSEDILAWQRWAIDRGLVASFQKVSIPRWLLEIESQAPPLKPESTPASIPTPSAP